MYIFCEKSLITNLISRGSEFPFTRSLGYTVNEHPHTKIFCGFREALIIEHLDWFLNSRNKSEICDWQCVSFEILLFILSIKINHFSKPDLFITISATSKWKAIQNHLAPNQKAYARPDLTCRVFELKLRQLMKELQDGVTFFLFSHFFSKNP